MCLFVAPFGVHLPKTQVRRFNSVHVTQCLLDAKCQCLLVPLTPCVRSSSPENGLVPLTSSAQLEEDAVAQN